jgi:acetyl-CoA acetyltransferase
MDKLNNQIAIVGIGETEYVRKSGRSVKVLILEAVQRALKDAGISLKEVDGIVTDGRRMPSWFPHDELVRNLGLHMGFTASISVGGAGNVASPLIAAMAIASGQAKVVVSYYGVTYGSDRSLTYDFHKAFPSKVSFEVPYGFYGQAAYFGVKARRYMDRYGLSSEELASILGSIAVTQRQHAVLNGRGQMKTLITYEDYERSPVVSDPLRVLDCCLLTDGACAWVMTSAERAKDCPHPPVYVMGVGIEGCPTDNDNYMTQAEDCSHFFSHYSESTKKALRMAGITLDEVDFAEIYDCFTIELLTALESIGFCKEGEAGAFVKAGNTSLKGSLPVNTHGGHLSHSYLVGASHIPEAVRQLRGEAGAGQVPNAGIGLVAGPSADCSTLILRKA